MASFSIIFINLLSMVLIAIVFFLAWRQRSSMVAVQVLVITAFMLIWATGSFVEMLVSGFDQKLLWRNITQIGVFYAPAACLIFAVEYSGILKKIKKTLACVIYGVQTFSILLIMTDQWHHLARRSVELSNSDYYQTIVVNSTAIGNILVSINFILMVAALSMLAVFACRTKSRMKKQVLVMFIGMSFTAAYAIIKVISKASFAIDVPISGVFAITSFSLLLGIFKYEFLMVLPIARNKVFDIVEEGIIVSSIYGEVIDANEAAYRMLSRNAAPADNGKDIKTIERLIKKEFPELHLSMLNCCPEKISVNSSDNKYFFECILYEIKNVKKSRVGVITVVRDVTEQKISHDLLKFRAERDGLTGIYNRITFIEMAEKELRMTDKSTSLIFFDIDDFKNINDQYGHIAGDLVLMETCACINRFIDSSSILGRIGGEEFAVLLKNEPDPEKIAETLRENVQNHEFVYMSNTIHVTISAGIASGKGLNFHQLYQKADRMLYLAKQQGKNCVRNDRF